MQDVSIRSASYSDALCVHALATQVFLETYAPSGIRAALAREVAGRFSIAACESMLADPQRRVLLAEVDAHLVAFAELELGGRHELVGDVPAAELHRLYVQGPFVRRSIGSALLIAAEQVAAASGASTLWLTAWVGNARALAFYATRGYRDLGATQYELQDERYENRLFAKALRVGP